jgi:hypothetical protein
MKALAALTEGKHPNRGQETGAGVTRQITFTTRDIALLAERHKIDQAQLETIIYAGAAIYHNAGRYKEYLPEYWAAYHEPDTLDQVEKAASELSALLHDERNRRRLIRGQSDDFIAKVHGLSAVLDAVRLAASRNHRSRRPGKRGHPVVKGDLAETYRRLACFWREIFGDANFKVSTWHRGSDGLQPKRDAAAARFLLDAMKLIAPTRPRLGEELRNLMKETVASLPGARQGRRLR